MEDEDDGVGEEDDGVGKLDEVSVEVTSDETGATISEVMI